MTDNPLNDSFEDQRRELELELVKIRSEANAARLEARAAELELMIRRMNGSQPNGTSSQVDRVDQADRVPSPHVSVPVSDLASTASIEPQQTFSSWDDVRQATASSLSLAVPSQSAPVTPERNQIVRVDRPSSVAAPHFPVQAPHDDSDSSLDVNVQNDALPTIETPEPAGPLPSFNLGLQTDASGHSAPIANHVDNVVLDELEIDDEEEQKRKSPTALVVSTFVHVGILVLLAAFTLSNNKPKDQVALSASVTEASEVSMETFQIETSEPDEPTDPTNETAYEISPVGEMAVAKIKPEAPPAPDSTSILQSTSSAVTSIESDSKAKIQFCGVEGGGNHFVYLVDSSGSMGDGFESARAELLNSISVLKPDQRFYVVFFDAEPDYMRLSDPSTDETRSVYATPENKQALKRWAMQIRKDRGRAPYDPLKFALKLEADVIFLLSDGEFPQGIEDLLQENNKVENLFGDSGPISIVHTIGYFSREGETRMRRIAEQNGGQYRHVPKP